MHVGEPGLRVLETLGLHVDAEACGSATKPAARGDSTSRAGHYCVDGAFGEKS